MSQKIRLRYDNATGLVSAEAIGFQGNGCLDAARKVLAAAGLEADPDRIELKPEFNVEVQQQQEGQRAIG